MQNCADQLTAKNFKDSFDAMITAFNKFQYNFDEKFFDACDNFLKEKTEKTLAIIEFGCGNNYVIYV